MSGLDISEVLATERAAHRHLDREVPREMRRVLAQAATDERRSHEYQNRTGDLERSTKATDPIVSDDEVHVDLVASMPYASYVNTRGLMQIDDLAKDAADELEYFFDGVSF
jgi:hypothetical protein